MSYKLTRRCDRDVRNLFLRGAVLFGHEQADRYKRGLEETFELVAANPRIARERTELRRQMRLHPYRAHVIFYVIRGDEVLFVRVLHGRQDWTRFLSS